MSGLKAIDPRSIETVKIRGDDVDAFGLTIATIVRLCSEFSEIAAMFGNKNKKDGFDVQAVTRLAAPALNAIVAAGLVEPDPEEQQIPDPELEQNVRNLKLGEKVKLMVAIVHQTAPDGFGPFGELLAAVGLIDLTAVAASNEGVDTPLPPGHVRLRSTKSSARRSNGLSTSEVTASPPSGP